jgi:hypothetical protein
MKSIRFTAHRNSKLEKDTYLFVLATSYYHNISEQISSRAFIRFLLELHRLSTRFQIPGYRTSLKFFINLKYSPSVKST